MLNTLVLITHPRRHKKQGFAMIKKLTTHNLAPPTQLQLRRN